MSKTISIYALKDPISHEVGYIGYTNNPEIRLRTHIGQACRKFKADNEQGFYYPCRSKRDVWIRELSFQGLVPYMVILMECPEGAKEYFEGFWYNIFVETGLYNSIICHKNVNAKLN